MNELMDDDFLIRCREVTKNYEKICGRWSFAAQLNHMHDETSEISDTLRNKKEKYGKPNSQEYRMKLLDEIADYFLVAMPLLDMCNITNHELNSAIEIKLNEVARRIIDISSKTVEKEGQP